MPIRPVGFGLPWTPDDAAAALAPYGDAGLLRDVLTRLGVPQVEPGCWDAADLLGVHVALAPWRSGRSMQATSDSADTAA